MSFRHIKGPALQELYPKTASVTLTLGGAVDMQAGFLSVATAGALRIFGILQTSAVSSASDFASATKIPVILPQENDEFEVDLTGAVFTATRAGQLCDLDATGQFVDSSATSHKQVTILRQGSTTSKVVVKINGAYTFVQST